MKRRIIAALMCLCMLVGLLPTSVFATKPEPDVTVEPVTYTASRVEDISELRGNKSTNGQTVAAAIWKTVENGQEMFYVAVAYAKQHAKEQRVDETDSKWEVYENDPLLKVTVGGEEKFNKKPSNFGKNQNTTYWYIAAFSKEEMSAITVSGEEYKFTLPPLPGGFQLSAITLPKNFVEEEILGLSVKKTVVKIGKTDVDAQTTNLSAQVNDTIIYKIEVKNTGEGTLDSISVADKMGGNSLLLYSDADCTQKANGTINSLGAGATETYYAAYTVVARDAGKPLTNTVTATKGNTKVQDSVTVTVQQVVEPATKYTVTYDANGGTTGAVPVDESQYASGVEVTVKGKTENLAKEGAVFLGWSKNQKETNITTEAEANSKDILKAGDKFNIDKNTNLYAVWATDVIDKDSNNNVTEGSDGIPDCYQAIVTYQVSGGTWQDGKTDDIKKVFDLYENPNGIWTEKDPAPTLNGTIPQGMKANTAEHYTGAGSWSDPAPGNNTYVTGSVAYTYRFDKDPVWINTYNTIRIYMDQGTKVDFNNLGWKKQVYVESDGYILGGRVFAYMPIADFWYTTNLVAGVTAGDVDSIILKTGIFTEEGRIEIPATGNQDYSVTFSEGRFGINNEQTYLRIDIIKKTPSSDNYILTYNANGGEFGAEDSAETVREVNVSKDAANNYQLGQEEGFVNPIHANKDGVAVAFGGWTTEDTKEAVYAADVPNAITALTMTEDDIVYAIWGYDANGNGIPDYKEETENAYFYVLKPGKVDATGTDPQNFFYVGQGSIFDKTNDVTDFTGNGVREHISKLPDVAGLEPIGAGDIAGKVGANFSNVLWYRVTTANGANSNNSGSPIVGSDTSTRHVDGLLKPDAAHYTVLFALKNDDDTIKSIVHSATIPANTVIGEDTVKTANAAALKEEKKDANAWTVIWKDKTGNDVSNVAGTSGTGGQILFFYANFVKKDATYTLTYDANAQSDQVKNLPPSTQHPAGPVTLSTQKPTHTAVKVNPNDEDEKATAVVFIGWTKNRTEKIFAKGDIVPTTVTTIDMTEEGKTVYAAWGYDTNNNDIPDVIETKYTLTYHANGGIANTLPTDPNKYLSSETVTLSTELPKHENVDGKRVKCIGWSTTPDNNIYAAGEYYGDTVSKVTFANANITVYAVWGYGTNNNYDGHHSKYTLYYHPNFGRDQKANESTNKNEVVVQYYERLNILPEREGYTFVSWNTKPDGSGMSYRPGDDFELTKSEHHLYAQWQKDKTGPDDSGVSNWLETDDHKAYLTGYPDSTFRADRNMTRAEVAQMFYALLLDKNVTITKSFSDVPDDAWYATAVKTLASLGMMDGYPDGTFRPDEPITRAEFATVGLAFAYDPLDADCSYYDVSASAWYHTYVAQATTYGWIGGYPDNTFRPGNNITRVEVCVIVNNMLGRDADERYIDRHEDELVHFVDLSDSYWGYYTIMESTNTHEYTGSFTNEKWTDVK